jgi:hypothetical protein
MLPINGPGVGLADRGVGRQVRSRIASQNEVTLGPQRRADVMTILSE